jgi:hypothetical protein
MFDLRKIIDDLAAIPDHLQALAIIVAGATLTAFNQHDTGQALIAAGLAMWRGQAK